MVRPATCWHRSIRAPSGRAGPGPGHPDAESGPAGKRPPRPAALPGPVQAGLHRQTAGRHAGRAGAPVRRRGQERPANVDNAKLQLDYSRITAPISGRLGLRRWTRATGVQFRHQWPVVITQTQPISVVFTLPETQLPEVRAELAAGHTLTVEAYDRADTRRIATGKLETLDNQIDVATGTLKLKARFDNADDALFPNQFVNARLHVTTRRTPPRFPSRRCSRARPALSSSWSRTTIRWPCGRSSWAPSTTAWWRSTRACSPATGS